MGSDLVNKVLDVFGLVDEEYDTSEYSDYEEKDPGIWQGFGDRKSKLVDIGYKAKTGVVMSVISSFNEVTKYSDYLKEKKIVIMDFKKLDTETAQRCVDFLSGVLYTIDGYIQEISSGILLLAPKGVEISSDINGQLTDSGILSWIHKGSK